MLVTQERAEYITELSYKLYEYKKYDKFFTLTRAMELDKNTADKVISQLEFELKDEEMKEKIRNYGGRIYYADDEIIEIDNYQYVDYIKYDLHSDTKTTRPKEIFSITCKMYEGESFEIPALSQFYAPHIYGKVIKYNSSSNEPQISNTSMRELYLKLLIVEDRLVNPYMLSTVDPYGRARYSFVAPMKEAIDNFKGYDKEIDILNRLLKVCQRKIISAGAIGGFADIGIKPTVLYLESIEEKPLADELRLYDTDPLRLNMVLARARKGYSGLTFRGKNTQVQLL